MIIQYHIGPYVALFQKMVKGISATITTLKEVFSSVFNWVKENVLDPFLDKIEAVRKALSRIGDAVSGGVGKLLGKRASGGPVTASTPYLVGERGPELFVPNTYGSIVPNGAMGAAGALTINITGNSFMGEDDMAVKVGNKIVDILKLNTKL